MVVILAGMAEAPGKAETPGMAEARLQAEAKVPSAAPAGPRESLANRGQLQPVLPPHLV